MNTEGAEAGERARGRIPRAEAPGGDPPRRVRCDTPVCPRAARLRGLASAGAPFGWPLVIGGALKASYDLLLLAMFRAARPPEERGS